MTMYEADRWFELAVSSYGHCESCGYKHGLKCVHIISKQYTQTRTSFRNAVCLCGTCEKRFIDNPRQFRDWLDTTWAKEYIRGEHLKNILEKDREPIDWNYRKFVAKKVYEDKMGILIARAKDL